MSDKLKKNRLVEANVTEISFVPDGAVEDAEYMVLRKELDEGSEELSKEEDLLEEPQLKDAFDIMLRRLDELEGEDRQTLIEALGIEINNAEQVEAPADDAPPEEPEAPEASTPKDEIEKEHTPEPTLADLQEKVDGILSALEKLDIKHTSDQPCPSELEKEEPAEEDPISAAVRIMEERKVAAMQKSATDSTDRLLQLISTTAEKLESVSNKFADTERRLARACGQDA